MSSEAHATFQRTKFFPALDGLRALSILAVIWHHAGGEQSTGLLARGFHGVGLFFAISGFLITTLLLREQAATGTISLPRFYLRRTLRIFPLYYAVVALYCLVVFALDRHSQAGRDFFANLPAFLTYTSNWFVERDAGARVIFYFAWSLATEEQFYLCWPSVVRFARRWWVPVAVMATLVVADTLGEWAVRRGLLGTEWLPVRMLVSVATPICLGCLAAYALARPASFAVVYRFAGKVWSAPLALVLLGLTLSFEGVPELPISLAMTFVVVSVCIRPDHPLGSLLSNPVARHVGTVSYGMYLLHMLSMNVVARAVPGAGAIGKFVLGSLLVTALATPSYYLFEKRLLDLKDRLATPRPRPLALATPVRSTPGA